MNSDIPLLIVAFNTWGNVSELPFTVNQPKKKNPNNFLLSF